MNEIRKRCLFWGKVRTTKIRTSKTKKNIEKIQNHQNIENVHLFSIKVIRTSKIENINYLWRITYGYQGLWGVRLGSDRLGQVRLGSVRLGQVKLCQFRLGQVRLSQVKKFFKIDFSMPKCHRQVRKDQQPTAYYYGYQGLWGVRLGSVRLG